MRLIIFRGKNREQSTTHTTRIITLQWKLSIMEVEEKATLKIKKKPTKTILRAGLQEKNIYIFTEL